MRQQLTDTAVGPGRQPVHHILEIGIRIKAVELGRLDQAHDGSGSLPSPQAARKQPVLAAQRNRAHLVLDPVVVDRYPPILQEPGERRPAAQAVIHGLGRGRPTGHLPSVFCEPEV